MTSRNVAATLPRGRSGPGSSSWIGMLLLVAIEATAYGAIVTSYFYLQLGAERWPPDGIAPPELLASGVGTAALVASTVPLRFAERASRRGDERRVRRALLLALGLALAQPIASAIDAGARDYGLAANAYASIVWVASGYGFLHTAALLGLGGYAVALTWSGAPAEHRRAALGVIAVYWYFAAIASIPLWATLYLAPYALGA